MLNTDLVPAPDGSKDRLLILLHGLGDSMEGWRFFPDELGLPWLTALLVDAPDTYYGGYAWYDFFGDQAGGIQRSRKMLHELLDATREMGFASERTVLMGFSQGCVMTLDAGLRYPSRLGGLIGLSGYVHEPARLLLERSPVAAQQKVLVTHGTLDPLLPIAPTREQVQVLQAAGIPIEWHEFRKEHTLDMFRELEVIRDFVKRCLPSENS